MNETRFTKPMGNLLAVVHPDSSVEKWTRDDLDLVLTHTNALGYTTAYTRDTNYRKGVSP